MYKNMCAIARFVRLLSGITWLSATGMRSEESRLSEVVELPKFEVKATREIPEPERWLYCQVGKAEVISMASDRDTRKLMQELASFHAALRVVWPLRGVFNKGMVQIIICAKRDQFRAFIPKAWDWSEKADNMFVSMFFKERENNVILVDFGTARAHLATHDAATLLANALMSGGGGEGSIGSFEFTIDHKQQLYREYVRFLLSSEEGRAAAWLEEGMAQVLMGLRIGESEIVLGKLLRETPPVLITPSMKIGGGTRVIPDVDAAREWEEFDRKIRGQTDHDFNYALHHRKLIPLGDFFGAKHTSLQALSPIGGVWAKQAQAFVHMCLFGYRGKYNAAFMKFVAEIKNKPVTEALFKECYGVNYKAMTEILEQYIRTTVYTYSTVKAVDGVIPKEPQVDVQPASEADVGRIKGAAYGLGGNWNAARNSLMAPYIRGSRDPLLLGAIGLAEEAVGDLERARKFMEVAVRGAPNMPRLYLELARLRFDQALKASSDGKLRPDEMQAVLEPLFVARAATPVLPEVYMLIADAWERSQMPPTEANLDVLIEGINVFNRDVGIIVKTASLYKRNGIYNRVDELVARGLEMTDDVKTSERLKALRER